MEHYLVELERLYDRKSKDRGKKDSEGNILLHRGHDMLGVDVEIEIDVEGNFISFIRYPVGKEKSVVLLHVESEGRSKGDYPHLTSDIESYFVKGERLDKYLSNLQEFIDYCGDIRLQAVYKYLSKGTFEDDLEGVIKQKVKRYIRFRVAGHENVWEDIAFFELGEKYYDEMVNKKVLEREEGWERKICNISGREGIIAKSHFKGFGMIGANSRILTYGEKVKLGRIIERREIFSINKELSDKAFRMMKWLMAKQSIYHNKDIMTIIWSEGYANKAVKVLQLGKGLQEIEASGIDESFVQDYRKSLLGEETSLGDESVFILGLDGRSSKGRVAVTQFKKLKLRELMEGNYKWNNENTWIYRGERRMCKLGEIINILSKRYVEGGTFDLHRKQVLEMVMGSVLAGHLVDDMIVNELEQIVLSRNSWKESEEWQKGLFVLCSLRNKRDGEKVELNLRDNDRDYLLGRLFGNLVVIEDNINYWRGIKRENQFELMFREFKSNPEWTWEYRIEPRLETLMQVDREKWKDRRKGITEIYAQLGGTLGEESLGNRFYYAFSLVLEEEKARIKLLTEKKKEKAKKE